RSEKLNHQGTKVTKDADCLIETKQFLLVSLVPWWFNAPGLAAEEDDGTTDAHRCTQIGGGKRLHHLCESVCICGFNLLPPWCSWCLGGYSEFSMANRAKKRAYGNCPYALVEGVDEP